VKPTLHLIGLPHTQTVVEGMTVCAFTSKLVKFAEMMTALGYPIIVYSGEHNDAHCIEHVPCFTDEQQREWYGDHDPNLLPMIATWNSTDPCWVEMNTAVTAAIRERVAARDIILLLAGRAQKPIGDAFPGHIRCEWAVGYEGAYLPYLCFESLAWKHYLWGKWGVQDGRWYDTVIPNFFRPQDFQLRKSKSDDLLFVGRVIQRKGPQIALEVAKRAGRKLLVAGAGVAEATPGRIVTQEGWALEGDVEYLGVLGVKDRNLAMGRAYALLCPTTYIEPFGAVAVEAMLCGTPAISVPWGAFSETIVEGVTGYTFQTLQEGADAVKAAGKLNPTVVRSKTLARYSLRACGPMYDRWFGNLSDLRRAGWYA
jgi:glycosyltransferase involved in cell wall biosynthesis